MQCYIFIVVSFLAWSCSVAELCQPVNIFYDIGGNQTILDIHSEEISRLRRVCYKQINFPGAVNSTLLIAEIALGRNVYYEYTYGIKLVISWDKIFVSQSKCPNDKHSELMWTEITADKNRAVSIHTSVICFKFQPGEKGLTLGTHVPGNRIRFVLKVEIAVCNRTTGQRFSTFRSNDVQDEQQCQKLCSVAGIITKCAESTRTIHQAWSSSTTMSFLLVPPLPSLLPVLPTITSASTRGSVSSKELVKTTIAVNKGSSEVAGTTPGNSADSTFTTATANTTNETNMTQSSVETCLNSGITPNREGSGLVEVRYILGGCLLMMLIVIIICFCVFKNRKYLLRSHKNKRAVHGNAVYKPHSELRPICSSRNAFEEQRETSYDKPQYLLNMGGDNIDLKSKLGKRLNSLDPKYVQLQKQRVYSISSNSVNSMLISSDEFFETIGTACTVDKKKDREENVKHLTVQPPISTKEDAEFANKCLV